MSVVLHYEPKMQTCSCCGKVKSVTEFYAQAYTGLPSQQCKGCTLIKRRAERQKAKTGKFISKEKQREMKDIDYDNNDWKAALLHFEGHCAYCGRGEGRARDARFDREHFVPVSRGGETSRHNVGPACRKCNRGRGNAPLFPWFRKQEFWTHDQERKIVTWIGSEAAIKEGYYARRD